MKDNKSSSKYKRLIGDTFIFALGNLGSKIILFFMIPLYTNCLTTEEYGTADFVFTIAQLVIPFVSLVIFDAVLRFGLAQNANRENVLKTSLSVILAGSVLSVILTPIFNFYEPISEWKWYLCVYVIFTMLGYVLTNYLKLIDKNKLYAFVSVVHTAVLAFANMFLLFDLRLGIQGYLIAAILGSISTCVLSFLFGRMWRDLYLGKVDRILLKEMILFSAPLILNNVSWWVIQSSDKIMIEAMVGAAALGLYTTATKIPSLINVIISIFSQAWGISSVREYESSNDNNFYSDVFSTYSFLTFGVAIMIATIAKPFMAFYVSENFFDSWRYVPLLLSSAAFSSVSSYFGSLYGALKKSINSMASTLIAAIVNIFVNYITILHLGTWGAVIGTVTAYVIISFYRMFDVLRYIKFDPNWRKYLTNCLVMILHALCVSFSSYGYLLSVLFIILYAINNLDKVKSFSLLVKNVLGIPKKKL